MNKTIVFLAIFLFAVNSIWGQATPVAAYRIANNSTAVGVNMPVGTQVFDVAAQKLYIALRPVPATITIQIGLEAIDPYFKEFAFGPEIPRAPDGTAVVELVSSSGRIWMDRNLGATQAATSSTDYLAYGSFFQWCRAADGHEKYTWTSSTTGTPVNGSTSILSETTTPAHSLFIVNSSYPYDWLSTPYSDGSLWWNGTTAGVNSPCPTGYHVPTKAEWDIEVAQGITNSSTAYSKLKLPLSLVRASRNGSVHVIEGTGFYWSSSAGNTAYRLLFSSNFISITGDYRGEGFSVRCIKNQ